MRVGTTSSPSHALSSEKRACNGSISFRPEHTGRRVSRTEPARIARHDAEQLLRHAVCGEQIVTRHILDIEELVHHNDVRHGYELDTVLLSVTRRAANSGARAGRTPPG